jgi:hypothetical protein
MTKPHLFVHELLIIVIASGALLLITFITYINNKDDVLPTFKQDDRVTVSIGGAVLNPGVYTLEAGATIETLLEKAQPSTFANLDKMKGKSKLKDSSHFTIHEKPTIKVYFEGAVKVKGGHKLPKGTRYCDIPHHIALEDDADLSEFQNNKKKLVHEDVVVVPILLRP